jgi:hypothetical protein
MRQHLLARLTFSVTSELRANESRCVLKNVCVTENQGTTILCYESSVRNIRVISYQEPNGLVFKDDNSRIGLHVSPE